MNYQKMLESLMLSLLICAGMYFVLTGIYSLGFYNGFYLKRDTGYVKKGLIKEGNIIKYPFGKKGWQASETSDSNCTQESGEGTPPAA